MKKKKPEDPIIFRNKIDRRDFLKVSGAAAGAAVAVKAAKQPVLRTLEEISPSKENAEPEEKKFWCICRPNCGGFCPIYVHVRDGRVVKTSMAPYEDPVLKQYNRICLRGLSNVQRIYDPDRIKYPMKRAGERGEDKWERITWEEAITTITDKWKEIQAKYGEQAVAFYQGSGNSVLLNGAGLRTRFSNAIGATGLILDVDAASSHGLNRVVGNMGLWVANETSDIVNAKTIVAWGSNMTEAQVHWWHFFADAIEGGTKLIVIDPVYTNLAAKAHEYIPIRPGTDAALTLSMMNVIINKGLHNVDFLLKHTVAPFLVREDTKVFLRMSDLGVEPKEGPADASGKPTKIDPVVVWDTAINRGVTVEECETPALEGVFELQGIRVRTAFEYLKEEVNKYPPEVASKITEVDAATIEHLAMVSLDIPVTHFQGWGSQAYENGVHTTHALATLAAITGNIGFPGASIGACWNRFLKTNGAFNKASDKAGPSMAHLVYRKTVKSGTFQGKPFPVKAMYVLVGNPMTNVVNSNEWINEILPTLELVVVADSVFNDTARYADILLPVAQFFEQEDVANGGQTFLLQWSEKAIEPLYESKTDADIFRLLADKMGVGEFFAQSDREMLAEILNTPQLAEMGVTVDSLIEKKAIRWLKYPFIAWEGNKFLTPSGRMEFYVEKPARRLPSDEPFEDLDRERLPRFFPPAEAWPENPLFEKYPLVLLPEHPKFRVHTQFFGVPWLRELDPEPVVKISAQDAAKRGIANGDIVEVFNDRGHAVVKAVVSQGIKPGVMVYPKGWQSKQYIAGNLAELSSSSFDPIGVNQNFDDELADVRKWNGEV